ncbi:MAG: ThiF family adenylyltransferase [Nanoarchaeota archaeon]|nr:ThiF family adenylyltransferase [Nanoarchaeota archaeon]
MKKRWQTLADYSRQTAIFDQAVLRNSKIAVIGAGNTADFFLLYAAGLGIGNVILFNAGSEGFLKKDYSLISRINSDTQLETVNSGFEPAFIGKVDAIADFTDDKISKKAALDCCARRNARLFVSASPLESFCNPSILSSLLWRPSIENSPLPFSSGLKAAIVLDEIRKALLPLPGDELISGKLYFSLASKRRFFEKPSVLEMLNEPVFTPKTERALVIGAGGIGTYVALNLALLGIPMEIYDGDKVEPTNLNRQVFYYDSIGKNKAKALKEKLEALVNANIKANSFNFDEKQWKKTDYSAVFSCVDSWQARKIINAYALKNNLPLIDAGVGPFTARLDICNKNACLECRRGKIDEKKSEGVFAGALGLPSHGSEGGCASLQESNVVMCNAFIGAMAAAEFYAMQLSRENSGKQLLYFSKKSLKEKVWLLETEKQCNAGCECSCHRRKNA